MQSKGNHMNKFAEIFTLNEAEILMYHAITSIEVEDEETEELVEAYPLYVLVQMEGDNNFEMSFNYPTLEEVKEEFKGQLTLVPTSENNLPPIVTYAYETGRSMVDSMKDSLNQT